MQGAPYVKAVMMAHHALEGLHDHDARRGHAVESATRGQSDGHAVESDRDEDEDGPRSKDLRQGKAIRDTQSNTP